MTAERETNDRDADEVLAVMRRYTDAAFRATRTAFAPASTPRRS